MIYDRSLSFAPAAATCTSSTSRWYGIGSNEEAAVRGLVEFCRTGPDRAEVHDVEVAEEEPEGLDGFTVR